MLSISFGLLLCGWLALVGSPFAPHLAPLFSGTRLKHKRHSRRAKRRSRARRPARKREARRARRLRHRQRLRRRSRLRRRRRALPTQRPTVRPQRAPDHTQLLARFLHHVTRLALLSGLVLLTGSPLWFALVPGGFLLLCELLRLVAFGMGSPRLLRLLPRITRVAHASLFVACVAACASLEHDSGEEASSLCQLGAVFPKPLDLSKPLEKTTELEQTDPWLPGHYTERLEAALAFRLPEEAPAQPPVRLELKDGNLRILFLHSVILELPALQTEDQTLAMALARMLKYEDGAPLFSYHEIAEIFEKKSTESGRYPTCKLERVGGSLVQMILRNTVRRTRVLAPKIEKLVGSFWENDPLATPEQCHQWLCQQDIPEGLLLPSVECLSSLSTLPGNLVSVRRSIRKILEPKGAAGGLRLDVLASRMSDIIEAQDHLLKAAGLVPIAKTGAVKLAMTALKEVEPAPSKTAQALCHAIAPLAAVPSVEQDALLATQVGLEHLGPLHFGFLYCGFRLSIAQVAGLVGRSKSVVYRSLLRLAEATERLDLFPPAQGFSGVLGLDEKWLCIPKSYAESERKARKKWRYAHFAVDLHTGDLLHVDVFESSDLPNVRAFLVALRARGIRPKSVVTDMWAGYEGLIEEVFGAKVVHHFCLFHHLQAFRERMRNYCGKDWKNAPLLQELVKSVDHIYDCQKLKTAKKRLQKTLALRPILEAKHPEVLPLLDLLEKRFPKVSNCIGRRAIPTTNNGTERVIKAFNQHYKTMAGLESITTARAQLRLFRFFYRLTPQYERVNKGERGLCPLELAGFKVRGTPLADYVRFTTRSLAGPEPPSLAA